MSPSTDFSHSAIPKAVRGKKRKAHDDEESSSSLTKRRLDRPLTPSSTSDALDESPFYKETYSLFLPLSPICYNHPLQGLCAEHLSPLILSYHIPFHGVVISYENTKLSAESPQDLKSEIPSPVLARSVDEYAASFVWLTADFLLFRPRKNDVMEGWINLQNEGNLGLVYLNFFNVSIERKRLPKSWRWVPGGMNPRVARKSDKQSYYRGEDKQTNGDDAGAGYFVNEGGEKVDGLVRFKVVQVETSRSSGRENSFFDIEGTMLSEEEEKELGEQNIIGSFRF
ncbi:hypothetical protein MMC31_000995 [Peltigera leucophlebia]|nr:hypothetical protein [Peltigera leucophlebia]